MTRADLLALTPDALAALANRGLVKRATKDLDAGNGPEVSTDADGTVEGRFPDGAETALPVGAGLEAATCTCAAPGICRHRICLILAYQRESGAEATAAGAPTGDAPAGDPPEKAAAGEQAAAAKQAGPPEDWSPGVFDDDALARVLGERCLTAARRTRRTGYAARVRRPTAADPVAQVELPACTVRFLVPHELGYVHTDATSTVRGEVIVLAVWAFREADGRGLTGADVRIDVGGGSAASGTGLESAVELADQVLLEGAMHAGPVLATSLRRCVRELTARELHWPAAALEDAAEQLGAYHERRADYDPARFAELLTELHARHRAGGHDGGSPRSQIMGSNESAETPLRRVRLTALGCRVGGTAERRTVDVFLAHGDSGVVLVLKRRWDVPEDTALTGADVAGRRISGAPLRAFATANVVSETASRSASRVVRLAAGRVAKTTITPLGTSWTGLPASLLATDLRALQEAMDALPPRLIRPRVEAETVRVVEIAEVRGLGYHPGDQRLEAVIADAAGTTALVSATYSPHAPAALDALAEALKADPSHISGAVSRAGGGLVIDPVGIRTEAGGVVALDLAPGDGAAALDGAAARAPDPVEAALDGALNVCADAAHRGLLHAPAGLRGRLGGAARSLERLGLRAAAGAVDRLATVLGGDDQAAMTSAWADAQLRLITTAELR